MRITDGHLGQVLAEKKPDCLIISALAPGGAAQARDGCRRLRPRYAAVKIVVGLWNAHGSLTKTRARLEAAGADFVATSIAEALEKLSDFARPAEEADDASQDVHAVGA
jgi:hypothetical protein